MIKLNNNTFEYTKYIITKKLLMYKFITSLLDKDLI